MVFLPPFFFVWEAQLSDQDVVEILKNISLKAINQENLELYQFEYFPSKKLLRLFIINPKTKSATMDNCVQVDRAMTPLMEESVLIPDSIILEVSSPGMYREISTEQHFQWAVGERIKLQLKSGHGLMNGKGKEVNEVLGKLENCKKVNGDLMLTVLMELEQKIVEFSFTHVRKAKVEPKI